MGAWGGRSNKLDVVVKLINHAATCKFGEAPSAQFKFRGGTPNLFSLFTGDSVSRAFPQGTLYRCTFGLLRCDDRVRLRSTVFNRCRGRDESLLPKMDR